MGCPPGAKGLQRLCGYKPVLGADHHSATREVSRMQSSVWGSGVR